MASSEKGGIVEDEEIGFSFLGFLSEVDWSEPWIMGLISWHILMFLVALIARRKLHVQCGLFLTLLSLVYFSEDINTLAATHWRAFSKQQYFDSEGMFISIMFSMPILLNCLLIVCNWLWCTNGALSQVMEQKARVQMKAAEKKAE
ncbi:transmembrane protein 18-like [Amphibalanus amphitrite]|uniref:transmembrane protein 18-like n=1 Tax=Amphibalanus amphitrite TaxID=1232801 RepID=UPI001C912904|nr:transmembrane protein 18-like [Amphibalanus amphitrite]